MTRLVLYLACRTGIFFAYYRRREAKLWFLGAMPHAQLFTLASLSPLVEYAKHLACSAGYAMISPQKPFCYHSCLWLQCFCHLRNLGKVMLSQHFKDSALTHKDRRCFPSLQCKDSWNFCQKWNGISSDLTGIFEIISGGGPLISIILRPICLLLFTNCSLPNFSSLMKGIWKRNKSEYIMVGVRFLLVGLFYQKVYIVLFSPGIPGRKSKSGTYFSQKVNTIRKKLIF